MDQVQKLIAIAEFELQKFGSQYGRMDREIFTDFEKKECKVRAYKDGH